MQITLDNLIPNFNDVFKFSTKEDASHLYNMSARELFELNDMSAIRNDQTEFETKINLLSKETVLDIRHQALAILGKKVESSQFGFLYGDFGRSKMRMEKNLELLRKSHDDLKNSKICELGSSCGGWTAFWFFHQGAINPENYTVSDIIPDFCRILSIFGFKGLPLNLVKENVLEVHHTKYDVMLLTEVIEHLPSEIDGFDLIDSSIKMLNSDGSLMISFPRDARPFVDDALGHHYQPDVKKIIGKFSSLFKETHRDYDGSREFILLKGLS